MIMSVGTFNNKTDKEKAVDAFNLIAPIIKEIAISDKVACKGEIYKCIENIFINANGEVVYKKTMSPRKKLSCKMNCKSYHASEELSEHISCGTLDLSNCIHGKYYKLKVTTTSVDFETGHADDWILEFIEHQPKSD
jgi:hypothetical protein